MKIIKQIEGGLMNKYGPLSLQMCYHTDWTLNCLWLSSLSACSSMRQENIRLHNGFTTL